LLVLDRGEWSVDADGALMILGLLARAKNTPERMTRQERIRLAEERLHNDNNVCHEPYGNKQRQPDGDH
jgi:hypothetical protein